MKAGYSQISRAEIWVTVKQLPRNSSTSTNGGTDSTLKQATEGLNDQGIPNFPPPNRGQSVFKSGTALLKALYLATFEFMKK